MIELGGKERTVGDAGAEQLVGFGRRLDERRGPERARHLLGDAAAGADLHAGQVLDLGDRPLGVEHLARSVREDAEQLDALVLADLLQIFPMDARVGHRVDHRGGATARQLGQERQHVAGGRVARRDIRDVDELVPDGVERAGRCRWMLGQHLQLDAAVGGLLHLLPPDREHVLGQEMAGRHPARHGQRRLCGSRLRHDRERDTTQDRGSHEHRADETRHWRHPPLYALALSGHLRVVSVKAYSHTPLAKNLGPGPTVHVPSPWLKQVGAGFRSASLIPSASSWRTPPSRPRAWARSRGSACGLRWWPQACVQIHCPPSGAAADRKMRPTTLSSVSTSELSQNTLSRPSDRVIAP